VSGLLQPSWFRLAFGEVRALANGPAEKISGCRGTAGPNLTRTELEAGSCDEVPTTTRMTSSSVSSRSLTVRSLRLNCRSFTMFGAVRQKTKFYPLRALPFPN